MGVNEDKPNYAALVESWNKWQAAEKHREALAKERQFIDDYYRSEQDGPPLADADFPEHAAVSRNEGGLR